MTLIHPLEAMSEGQRAAPETLWLRLLSLMKTVLLAYASSRIDLRLKSPLVNICFFSLSFSPISFSCSASSEPEIEGS